ncbi:hypothetical protein A2U01_0073004, partial [Trifolium medium]|nr:hypothetical protein [Trifolium medium]
GYIRNFNSFHGSSANNQRCSQHASYHLPEIWNFPPSKTSHFSHDFGDFAMEDPGRDQKPLNQGRKRRDTAEDLVKGVSTSNGGGNSNPVVIAHSII